MIAIGILGYGSRIPSAATLALLADHPEVSRLLIVWNEPDNEVSEALQRLKLTLPKTHIIENVENLGSAGGYKCLIEYFRDHENSEYLFLLDDDLAPKSDCIDKLLQTTRLFSAHLDNTVLLAYRPGLPEMHDLVKNRLGTNRAKAGACLSFHFMNLIKQNRDTVVYSENNNVFKIEFAPWGGMFIPRPALNRLGLPREDFFLYAEDTELTYRFTWNGGRIFLVPDAEITDTEPAWNTVGGNISNLRRRVLILSEIKVFHEVRNRNFMARHYYPGLLPIYWINKFLFLASAYFMAIANRKLSRALLIHQAINAGERMAVKEARSK
jgi:GT2 family glycosyltransferase